MELQFQKLLYSLHNYCTHHLHPNLVKKHYTMNSNQIIYFTDAGMLHKATPSSKETTTHPIQGN